MLTRTVEKTDFSSQKQAAWVYTIGGRYTGRLGMHAHAHDARENLKSRISLAPTPHPIAPPDPLHFAQRASTLSPRRVLLFCRSLMRFGANKLVCAECW